MAAVLLINIPIFAQGYDDDYDDSEGGGSGGVEFHLNFFSVGIGLHTGQWAGEGYIEVLRFGMEHRLTGLGFGFTPFHLYGIIGGSNDGNRQYDENGDSIDIPISFGGGASFINFNAYWNLFRIIGIEGFSLGPFFDLNWVIVHQGDPDPSEYMMSLGVQAGIRKGRILKCTVFAIEIGARFIGNYSGDLGNLDGARLFIAMKAGR